MDQPPLLVVDDDATLLHNLQRHLDEHFLVSVAPDGRHALEHIVRAREPFAAVLTDLIMPGIDGVRLLREMAATSPETVRVVLTGEANVERAINAINEGGVHHFLRKPCPRDELVEVLHSAVRHHRRLAVERDILDRTLNGAVTALLDTMAIADPTADASSSRIAALVDELIAIVEPPDVWSVRLAARLCHLGLLALPPELLRRIRQDRPITPDERNQFTDAMTAGLHAIGQIPRLEAVAAIVSEAHGSSRFLQSAARLEARMLRIALDIDASEARGLSRLEAIDVLAQREARYDLALLEALRGRVAALAEPVRELPITAVQEGMIFVESVYDTNGLLLVGRGQVASETLLVRLRNRVYNDETPDIAVVRCPARALDAGARPTQ